MGKKTSGPPSWQADMEDVLNKTVVPQMKATGLLPDESKPVIFDSLGMVAATPISVSLDLSEEIAAKFKEHIAKKFIDLEEKIEFKKHYLDTPPSFSVSGKVAAMEKKEFETAEKKPPSSTLRVATYTRTADEPFDADVVPSVKKLFNRFKAPLLVYSNVLGYEFRLYEDESAECYVRSGNGLITTWEIADNGKPTSYKSTHCQIPTPKLPQKKNTDLLGFDYEEGQAPLPKPQPVKEFVEKFPGQLKGVIGPNPCVEILLSTEPAIGIGNVGSIAKIDLEKKPYIPPMQNLPLAPKTALVGKWKEAFDKADIKQKIANMGGTLFFDMEVSPKHDPVSLKKFTDKVAIVHEGSVPDVLPAGVKKVLSHHDYVYYDCETPEQAKEVMALVKQKLFGKTFGGTGEGSKAAVVKWTALDESVFFDMGVSSSISPKPISEKKTVEQMDQIVAKAQKAGANPSLVLENMKQKQQEKEKQQDLLHLSIQEKIESKLTSPNLAVTLSAAEFWYLNEHPLLRSYFSAKELDAAEKAFLSEKSEKATPKFVSYLKLMTEDVLEQFGSKPYIPLSKIEGKLPSFKTYADKVEFILNLVEATKKTIVWESEGRKYVPTPHLQGTQAIMYSLMRPDPETKMKQLVGVLDTVMETWQPQIIAGTASPEEAQDAIREMVFLHFNWIPADTELLQAYALKKQAIHNWHFSDSTIELAEKFGVNEGDLLGEEEVEITISGLTPEEAEALLKQAKKQSKSSEKVMVKKKVMKEVGPKKKPICIWPFQSDSMIVNGEPLMYKAQLNEDGSVSCNCMGWVLGTAKDPKGRHCKHTDLVGPEAVVLYKKWKKGETFGEEFTSASEEVVNATSKSLSKAIKSNKPAIAKNGPVVAKRIIEL